MRDNGTTPSFDGWYIDDITIAELNKPRIPSFPFFDDFENGFGNWLVSGQDWDTTSVTYRTLDKSPGHSITDSPNGKYPAWSRATITLATPIDLSSSDKPVLTFWQKYRVNTDDAFCYVEISEDGGFTWSQLAKYTGYTSTLFPVHIDLANYKTSPILVRFRLRDNGTTPSFDGWYIDDVSITEQNRPRIPSFPFFDDFENGLAIGL